MIIIIIINIIIVIIITNTITMITAGNYYYFFFCYLLGDPWPCFSTKILKRLFLFVLTCNDLFNSSLLELLAYNQSSLNFSGSSQNIHYLPNWVNSKRTQQCNANFTPLTYRVGIWKQLTQLNRTKFSITLACQLSKWKRLMDHIIGDHNDGKFILAQEHKGSRTC